MNKMCLRHKNISQYYTKSIFVAYLCFNGSIAASVVNISPPARKDFYDDQQFYTYFLMLVIDTI